MQRLGTGYTMYFNEKEKRSGSLFQGVFKSLHINTNEYLLHLSAYVNLNDRVHQLGSETSKLVKSSWREYIGDDKKEFCKKTLYLVSLEIQKIIKHLRKNHWQVFWIGDMKKKFRI